MLLLSVSVWMELDTREETSGKCRFEYDFAYSARKCHIHLGSRTEPHMERS